MNNFEWVMHDGTRTASWEQSLNDICANCGYTKGLHTGILCPDPNESAKAFIQKVEEAGL